jgi:hypothetical protein
MPVDRVTRRPPSEHGASGKPARSSVRLPARRPRCRHNAGKRRASRRDFRRCIAPRPGRDRNVLAPAGPTTVAQRSKNGTSAVIRTGHRRREGRRGGGRRRGGRRRDRRD